MLLATVLQSAVGSRQWAVDSGQWTVGSRQQRSLKSTTYQSRKISQVPPRQLTTDN